ncbi:hypothetical protein M422DRAFT_202509 [Sphaerobolus stellatus SS14]|nr:hypothetical protein M422DRAFT_202509 [Sphaerobolus stellatus SS14]
MALLRLWVEPFSYVVKLLLLINSTVFALVSPPTESLLIQTTIGTFEGFTNTTGNYEAWLGIPYAEPPTGNLRFKAPVAITKPFKGIQQATAFGDACPQPVSSATVGVNISENCLVLNVFRPSGTRSNAKLPVLLWIHGGAFSINSASSPGFNSPAFIFERAAVLGKPVLFVSINYRINAFGFLASQFIEPQDLNMGLQDQVQAFKWVNNEIASFGGDPEKVTIWGQSAGAGSVEAHVLFTTEKPLFRAGILDSSTGPFKSAPFPFQYDEPGKTFGHILSLVGCPPPSPEALKCLQDAPFPVVMNASNFLLATTINHQAWQPTIAPGTFIDQRPSARLASGKFLRVPLLWGTNQNEGTTFSETLLGLPKMSVSEEDASFDQFVGSLILDNRTLTPDVLGEFNALYPANDPANGAPFNTGDSLFDRGAAWYGDNMFLAPRRLYFKKAAPTQNLFGYFFTEFFPGSNPELGVFHASELPLIFGGSPASEMSLATAFTDFYVNFVNDLNPGASWPLYNLKDNLILQLKKDNITPIIDDFLIEKTNFLNTAKVLAEFEK